MININLAYDFYVKNINKSCNTKILSFEEFNKYFPMFIEQMCSPVNIIFDDSTQSFINLNEVPFLTKCNKSVLLSINSILKKINHEN